MLGCAYEGKYMNLKELCFSFRLFACRSCWTVFFRFLKNIIVPRK